ncbi:hypothetical protein [Herpetosiphon llansteffanensis]|uniref:hypothetical protein n=1 Tax=Herpetosiphon llansteffanensis TaxID=2094568 RepID=UPI000D7C7749|nr:hypothetical protein [Herpetosiphon llansteffanensis]
MKNEINTPLLPSISQYEVDFLIPRIGVDIPIGIDPFLLYKSRDPELQDLHQTLIHTFNTGIELIKKNQMDLARDLFLFPEVSEIGLGYTKKGKKGSGIGEFLSELIIDTLLESPALIERGIKHIEEMQLVSLGIGPDRISDITANLIKPYLISYTQKQCQIWGIPLVSGVPLTHNFEPTQLRWYDGYFDLPISPIDNTPLLFVPRRIVRVLPWINYEDFFRLEFSAYLRAKRVKGRLSTDKAKIVTNKIEKEKIVSLTRTDMNRLDNYVYVKESTANDAQPSVNYIDGNGICPETELLKVKFDNILPGNKDAAYYQKTILEILNFLFVPELIDGEMEVKTIDGTERRDIVFTNDSDQSFWSYIRSEHSSVFLMFEVKNTIDIDNIYINQVNTYLGDRLGRLGFIVTRNQVKEAQQRKIFSVYNDSYPKKIILVLSDTDLKNMLDMKCRGAYPMHYIQKIYRDFRTKVQ